MDAPTALRQHLVDDAAVASVFGTRIYPVTFPQAPDFATGPAMTYQMVSNLTEYSHEGPANLNEARLQFDIYAMTYAALAGAADVVRRALSGWRGTIGDPPSVDFRGVFLVNEMDWPVPETLRAGPRLLRRTIDCNVFFSAL